MKPSQGKPPDIAARDNQAHARLDVAAGGCCRRFWRWGSKTSAPVIFVTLTNFWTDWMARALTSERWPVSAQKLFVVSGEVRAATPDYTHLRKPVARTGRRPRRLQQKLLWSATYRGFVIPAPSLAVLLSTAFDFDDFVDSGYNDFSAEEY